MIKHIKCDIFESRADYICHQVNCQGKMNSGIAKAIRERWPEVYKNYQDWYISYEAWGYAHTNENVEALIISAMLGKIQIVLANPKESCYVINMAAQGYYGYDGCRYTSYDAFWNCLNEIKLAVPEGSKIAFPYKIGCVRGGANWNIIYKMIEEVFADFDGEVLICEYNGG